MDQDVVVLPMENLMIVNFDVKPGGYGPTCEDYQH